MDSNEPQMEIRRPINADPAAGGSSYQSTGELITSVPPATPNNGLNSSTFVPTYDKSPLLQSELVTR